jgi:hypothetical protein
MACVVGVCGWRVWLACVYGVRYKHKCELVMVVEMDHVHSYRSSALKYY